VVRTVLVVRIVLVARNERGVKIALEEGMASPEEKENQSRKRNFPRLRLLCLRDGLTRLRARCRSLPPLPPLYNRLLLLHLRPLLMHPLLDPQRKSVVQLLQPLLQAKKVNYQFLRILLGKSKIRMFTKMALLLALLQFLSLLLKLLLRNLFIKLMYPRPWSLRPLMWSH
jgi:hypothetical protein